MATIKEKLEKLRQTLSKELLNLAEVTTAEGVIVVYEGDIVIGETKLFVYDEAGEQIPAPNGEYTIEDKKYVVAEGVITEEVIVEEPVVEENVIVEDAPTTEDIVEELPEEPAVDAIVEEIVDIVPEVAQEDEIDPVKALADIITKLVEKLDTMQAEMTAMKAEMSVISDQPVALPAEIAVKDEKKATGTTGAERAKAILQAK
jgi:hypothetical protein